MVNVDVVFFEKYHVRAKG